MAGLVKVLIVDDNSYVRDVLTCMLKEIGFQIITAVDGLMGLKMAEAERPDLIITDINMPHMNGIQMIARLRGQSEFVGVPILVVSSNGSKELDAALSAGANLAMHKPLDFDSLRHRISRLLAKGSGKASFNTTDKTFS
ncbi:MAG: response regulator [Blastocatellia bacterium]